MVVNAGSGQPSTVRGRIDWRHSPARTGYPRMRMARRLEELVREVEKGGSETSLERILVKGLLREYHEATQEGRNALVRSRPPRTGTVWDAVIAATIEHACETHEEPIPAWTQEPGRFLKEPWTACRLPISHATAFWNAPAAFIRHNTFIEPRNLDERTGEKHVWAADERTTSGPFRSDEREDGTGRPDRGGVHRGWGRNGAGAPSDTRNPGRRLVDPGRGERPSRRRRRKSPRKRTSASTG